MISLNFTVLLKFLIKIFLFLYENEYLLSEYVYNNVTFSQQMLMDNYYTNKVYIYIKKKKRVLHSIFSSRRVHFYSVKLIIIICDNKLL